MKEKDPIKIKLSTAILIIALIVIVIIGYFIYQMNNKEENLVNNSDNQATKLQNEVDNEETTNSSNITDNYKENDVNTNNNNKPSDKFSEEEMKNCIQEYLNLKGIYVGSPEGLLVKLGLISYEENSQIDSDNYVKTTIKYADYKNKMLDYMTEECFNINFTKYFKDVNGYLYYQEVGATGINYEVDSITLKGAYSDSSYIASVYNINVDDSKELENIEFHIEDDNGKCVISYCD